MRVKKDGEGPDTGVHESFQFFPLVEDAPRSCILPNICLLSNIGRRVFKPIILMLVSLGIMNKHEFLHVYYKQKWLLA